MHFAHSAAARRGQKRSAPHHSHNPLRAAQGHRSGNKRTGLHELLRAIKRLRTTEVETNIRAGKRRFTAFHYLGDIEGEGEGAEDPEQLKSLTLRVPDWLLDGILSGNILTLDREYFLLTGGIERADLSGGSQACRLSTSRLDL